MVPPWVEEHPEIFSADFSLTDDTPSVSVTDDSVFQMQGKRSNVNMWNEVCTIRSAL